VREQDSEAPCGSIRPHEAHTFGFASVFRCPGFPADTEYRVYAHGIKRWTPLRDEVAPALARDFRGALVVADERVVHLSYPDPNAWRGADIEILGLEYRTAERIAQALSAEFGLWDDRHYPDVRPLNAEEAERVRIHRG
jgi:hypothetical protein